MNKLERIRMIQSMEFIIRNLNDERDIVSWFEIGVADGDIKYGDFGSTEKHFDDLDCYLSDDDFADLMDTFACIMHDATHRDCSGCFYCDGVLSKETN